MKRGQVFLGNLSRKRVDVIILGELVEGHDAAQSVVLLGQTSGEQTKTTKGKKKNIHIQTKKTKKMKRSHGGEKKT